MRRSRVALALVAVAVAAGVVAVPAVVGRPSGDTPATPADPARAVATLRERATVPLELHTDGAGRLTALGTRPGRPVDLGESDPVAAAAAFVDRHAAALGAGATDLVVVGRTPRLDGGTAVRFGQEHGGVPVLGGEVSVQVAPGGGVLSAAADLSATATAAPTTVEVDEAEARTVAVAAVAREVGLPATRLRAEGQGRWIHDPAVLGDPAPFGPRLTWRFEVTGAGEPVRHLVLVDAATGSLALAFSQLGHAAERRVCDFADARSATDDCTTPTRVEGGPATGVADVDGAYDHTGATRDLFSTRFGRDGVDGAGTAMRASVRYCPTTGLCPYPNAYWDGTQTVYGTGYAVDDVVAHEWTHGVTEHTAGLFYWHQSGAINEAMSDIFGEYVDLSTPGDDDATDRWLIGEDLPGGALRDMADPGAFGDPDAMTSPAFYGGLGDVGGVHRNSGVANRAAVLMADGGTLGGHTVPALGLDTMAAVHYEALTAILTSASDYQDLHLALPQACRNLVGVDGLDITEADCQGVQEAVDAVAMDHVPEGQPTDAPVCDDDTAPQSLFAEDFETSPATAWVRSRVLPSAYEWVHPVPDFARFATSGTENLWGATTGDPWANGAGGSVGEFGDSRIAMATGVSLPPGTSPYLRFRHAFGFETGADGGGTVRNWDGGVVEYSTDGGGTWLDAGALFDHNGYTGTLDAATASPNPLWGRPAFTGRSKGYQSSRADLSPLAGQDVRFRFRVAEDEIIGDYGWFVDDVEIYLCPAPALEVTQTAGPATVTAGDEIEVEATLTNTGNVGLTGVTVTAATTSGCVGPAADLAPSASTTVTCTATTVDPDDVGAWTHELTATADQLEAPVVAEPATVTVLAPGTAALGVTHLAEATSVAFGASVPLRVTLQNTGNVALTELTVTAPDAPGCATTLPTPLAPAGETTLTCEHTPTALGAWASTVTVGAAELTEAVSASSGSVTVVDAGAPTATVSAPTDGTLVNVGDVLTAQFSCSDDHPGPVTCTATAGPSGVAVTDGEGLPTDVAGTHPLTVTAVDAAGNRTEVTRTYTVALRQPDAVIRKGRLGPRKGEGIQDAQGVGQTRAAAQRPGRTVSFYVTVQNDGDHPEALRLRGAVGTAHFRVRYLAGGQDVTALVRRGTYETAVLDPGAERTVRIVVDVVAGAPAGARLDRLLRVSSASDPDQRDAVRFVVRRR